MKLPEPLLTLTMNETNVYVELFPSHAIAHWHYLSYLWSLDQNGHNPRRNTASSHQIISIFSPDFFNHKFSGR